MTPFVFTLITFAASIFAGLLGSLLGLGGGIIITPVLTLFLGVPIHYAIGASIISVIATSSGSAAVYVKQRMTNLRLALLLSVATAAGALTGAHPNFRFYSLSQLYPLTTAGLFRALKLEFWLDKHTCVLMRNFP